MNDLQQHTEPGVEENFSLADYYNALTGLFVHHHADLLAIHYGLWGTDTTSDKQALLRANQTLVRGCDVGREWRVLDAGCGVGGTAIWLAQEFGCKVTGLSNCEPHVELASRQAEQRGVGNLVEFIHGDFMEMPFPDACFDAVLNHDSFCYAHDKLAYLQGVYRILKPGGRWQALDGFLTDKAFSERDEAIHADAQRGWRIIPFECWRNVLADLNKAGFKGIGEQNLDAEVAPATERLCNAWTLFEPYFTPPDQKWAYEGFKQASFSYYKGTRQGVFTYRLVFGVRP